MGDCGFSVKLPETGRPPHAWPLCGRGPSKQLEPASYLRILGGASHSVTALGPGIIIYNIIIHYINICIYIYTYIYT